MAIQLHALACGWLTGELGHLIEGESGRVRLPIPAYLIVHPKGTVLFDSGMHRDCQHDPQARLGPRIAGMFGFDYGPGEDVAARLEAIDRDPARIDYLVNSHLHFDHAGGNALIPNATLVLQRAEWEAGMDPERGAKLGFDRRTVDCGHPLKVLDGEHDLFGDGRVVCLPTPGHTPGHQSLKIELDSGPVVLAGDACYFCRTLQLRRLPPWAYDRAAMYRSLDRLAALERAGARIFFGHDQAFWSTLPHGRQAIT